MKNNFIEIIKKLRSKIYFNYNVGKLTWFRTGGKAKVFIIVENSHELEIILNELDNKNFYILGAGSNLLIRDKGFNGIIIKLGKGFNNLRIFEDKLEVGASTLDVNLSKFAYKNNISGLEFFSGIPGSVGGAVKMNAGCFGSETKNVLKDIQTINSDGEIKIYNKDKIKLSYRNSKLPLGDIILSANFNYSTGDKDEISNKMNEIKIKREASQPIKFKTSGSTFKNPKNEYAAKLIEMSGCKGLKVGDALVSEKHANFLINSNNASASQIEELGKRIIDKVYKKFNIVLEWEIKILGN